MSDPTPRQRAVTRAEFDELNRALEAASTATKETHDKVSDIHKALMLPSPGQEKSLLDRMALVTINVESGGRVASIMVKIAAVLAAIGVIWAMIASFGSAK